MKKQIVGMLCGFLAFMMVFTVLSRAADSVSVAQVSVTKPQKGKIDHVVSGSGKVLQNREQAVSTEPNQIVKTIYIEEGQQVQEGDLLFELELDSLKEQILEMKQNMKIADLQSEDKASGRDAQAWQRATAQNRAAEDYSVAAGKADTAISRAAKDLREAKKKLKALKKAAENKDTSGAQDEVAQVLQQTVAEKQSAYEEAVQAKKELEKEIEEAVKKALEDAKAGKITTASGLVRNDRELHTVGLESEDEAAGSSPDRLTETDTVQIESDVIPTEPDTAQSEPDVIPAEPDNVQTEEGSGETQPPAGDGFDDTAGGAGDAGGSGENADSGAGDAGGNGENTDSGTGDAGGSGENTDSGAGNTGGNGGIIDGGMSDTGGDNADHTFTPPTQTQLTILEQQVRQQNQPYLDTAEQWIARTKLEMEQAQKALEDYLTVKSSQNAADIAAMIQQQAAEVQAKQLVYNDAVTAKNDSLRAAGRSIEDASAPQASDSTGEIDEITREQQELALSKLEKLLEAEGKVTAPITGIVTRLNLTTGERTPDGTAVLLADTTDGNKLVVQVPAEQEKYIARQDEVKIKPNGNKETIEGLTVDSVRSNEENKEMLDVTVKLPEGTLEIGTSAELSCTKTSETYEQCVPLQALYAEKNKYFVYVLQETQSVLGNELTARRVDVTVLDKNETMAALSLGSLSGDQQIIVSSDKYIEAGSRVRLQEE